MSVVTLVNCFQIPAGREDDFFVLWQQVNTYMRQRKATWYTNFTAHLLPMPSTSP